MSSPGQNSLTPKESYILHRTAELWDQFLTLPVLHQSHQQDFEFHLHAIQRIISVRVCYRTNPDVFVTKESNQ